MARFPPKRGTALAHSVAVVFWRWLQYGLYTAVAVLGKEGRKVTGFDAPTKEDLERSLRSLGKDELEELKIAKNKLRFSAADRGMLQSSAHAVGVAQDIDLRFRAFVTKAVEHGVPFVGRLGSAKEVSDLLAPILEQFRDQALAEVPDVVGMRATLVPKYSAEFNARMESALRDFAIGQVNGKPLDHATAKARPLHQVNDTDYVDEARLKELRAIEHSAFDLRRLIRICEELNSSWQLGNYFAVPDLVRTIMDHIPPVFGGKAFSFVTANHGDRTFKDHMERLDKSLRHVADASLHRHIRKSETLPTASQVNFAADLDVLLGEVTAKLARP